jgi:Mg-chelatase subunit ChlD
VTDPEILRRLEPNFDLLKMLLTFRGHLKGVGSERSAPHRPGGRGRDQTAAGDRESKEPFPAEETGFATATQKSHKTWTGAGTIRKKSEELRYATQTDGRRSSCCSSRAIQRRLPWRVILCVDQSGSMAGSVIYSAVMAGILSGLPLINVNLVVFDTSVVDLSGHLDDPVQLLMNVQLGGGTHIGQAMQYCEQLVEDPHRTIVVLVSDFCEGAPPAHLLSVSEAVPGSRREASRIGGSQTKMPTRVSTREWRRCLPPWAWYIAALTPKHFAEWLAKTIS